MNICNKISKIKLDSPHDAKYQSTTFQSLKWGLLLPVDTHFPRFLQTIYPIWWHTFLFHAYDYSCTTLNNNFNHASWIDLSLPFYLVWMLQNKNHFSWWVYHDHRIGHVWKNHHKSYHQEMCNDLFHVSIHLKIILYKQNHLSISTNPDHWVNHSTIHHCKCSFMSSLQWCLCPQQCCVSPDLSNNCLGWKWTDPSHEQIH